MPLITAIKTEVEVGYFSTKVSHLGREGVGRRINEKINEI